MFGCGAHGLAERADDLVPGRVEGVQDAALRVAALLAEVVLPVLGVAAEVEVGAERDQVADPLRALADDHLDDVAVAEPGAGDRACRRCATRSCRRGSRPTRCRPGRTGSSSPGRRSLVTRSDAARRARSRARR